MTDENSHIEQLKNDTILVPLENAEDVRNWMDLFLGLKFPAGVVYPTSTHGPADAIWRIYELIKTGKSKEVPQVCLLASRDSYKTLAASAAFVLLMVHFRLQVATAGAIKSQSEKMIQYIGNHFRKIGPYLTANGWKKISESKSRTDWLDDNEGLCFIRVVVATIAGMNSEHVPILGIDEVDVVQDPRALEEGKMIPSVFTNSLGQKIYPLTVYLSTRKFAGGLMEKTLKETTDAGGEILRWNIVDVTERMPIDTDELDQPKVTRYIAKEMPLRNLSEQEFNQLTPDLKHKFEKFEAYSSIAEHPMLQVIKNYLIDRPQDDFDYLWKPIEATHNNFKQTSDDMAEAQLLCNKPSRKGLVYPNFDNVMNSLSVDEAYSFLSGEPEKGRNFDELIQYLKDLGIDFFGSADWGWTDETSLLVCARLPAGNVWIIDMLSSPGLEIDEVCVYIEELTKKYGVQRWFCDSNYPAYIKKVNKIEGVMAKGVDKGKDSVMDGITAVQSKVVTAAGKRYLKIIRTNNTERIFEAFETYKWKTDGKGDPIDGKPEHDKSGVADIMDSLRYLIYSLYDKAGKLIFAYDLDSKDSGKNNKNDNTAVKHQLKHVLTEKGVTDYGNKEPKQGGGIFWDI